MQVTVPHNKTQEDAVKLVDHSIDDLIRSIPAGTVKIYDPEKTWSGSTMSFSFKGRKGIFATTIHGTVAVTSKDITINAAIPGIVKNFVSEQAMSDAVAAKAKQILA
jgi:hypothetical protein